MAAKVTLEASVEEAALVKSVVENARDHWLNLMNLREATPGEKREYETKVNVLSSFLDQF